jgi:hypothetical protein
VRLGPAPVVVGQPVSSSRRAWFRPPRADCRGAAPCEARSGHERRPWVKPSTPHSPETECCALSASISRRSFDPGLNLVRGLRADAAERVELVAENRVGVLGADAGEPGRGDLVCVARVKPRWWARLDLGYGWSERVGAAAVAEAGSVKVTATGATSPSAIRTGTRPFVPTEPAAAASRRVACVEVAH